MTEYQIHKSADYSTIANYHLRDSRLTLSAKGLMSSMLIAETDGRSLTVEELAERGPEGRDAIRSALRKLEEAGYIRRRQSHDSDGRFGSIVMDVYEAPFTCFPSTVSPSTENPSAEKPSTVGEKLNKDYNSASTESSEADTGEQGRRLNPPEKPPKGAAPAWKPERFSGFWDFFAKQLHRGESKAAAIKAWDKLKPSDELIDTIGLALVRQKGSELWRKGVGIPYASTYLNQRRWEDETAGEEDGFDEPDMGEVTRWAGR